MFFLEKKKKNVQIWHEYLINGRRKTKIVSQEQLSIWKLFSEVLRGVQRAVNGDSFEGHEIDDIHESKNKL